MDTVQNVTIITMRLLVADARHLLPHPQWLPDYQKEVSTDMKYGPIT
jgi:hypothetical protein